MKKESQAVFDRNVAEFATVAAEFCNYLEQAGGVRRASAVDTLLKMLPLLYLKASLLPPCEAAGEETPVRYVTERIYEEVRMELARVMGGQDDYLDVFVSDMKYSDQPVARRVSEDLADIYQDVKDFTFAFRLGTEEAMRAALAACRENFALYWGQKLANALRALHDVKYAQPGEDEGSFGEDWPL